MKMILPALALLLLLGLALVFYLGAPGGWFSDSARHDESGDQAGHGPGTEIKPKINWRMQSIYGSKHPLLGTTAVNITKRLAAISEGRFTLKFFEPGSLVPSSQVFEAVGKASIQAGFSSPALSSRKNSAFSLFNGIPFGMSGRRFQNWILGAGRKPYEELYARHGIVPLPCGMYGGESFGWFRRPIHSPRDLKGLKIRFQGLGARVMKKMGASPKKLLGAEMFPAMDRGVLDAAEFSTPYLDLYAGLNQVAKNFYYPGWHQPFNLLELLVNKKIWDDLTPEIPRKFRAACRINLRESLLEDKRLREQALEKMRGLGVTIRKTPTAIESALREAWAHVAEEEMEKNPDFKRIYTAYKKFQRSNGK